ncbi:MAG: carbohydrate ABC transporter permease [Anaerolineae bacterium]|nr:carbohydrate ABC transporter permease [Thermoflexales bacterium]MDW8395073.1 carbohydrate ABC transporter permease [Anaerolineae bacterium]
MIRSLFRSPSPFRPSPFRMLISYLILGFWAFFILFPLYWLFITSFKLPAAVNNGPFYIPFVDFQPSLHAWDYILNEVGNDTRRMFVNTVGVALISATLALLIGASAAYALTRFQFRPKVGTVLVFIGCVAFAVVVTVLGAPWQISVAAALALFILSLLTIARRFQRALNNNDIAFWLISQRIMPPVAVVIPIYIVFQQLRLLDTWAALIITYVATNLPIVVWLMRDYFTSVPYELEESAQIDGASRLRIFTQIVLPLAKPGLVATFLFVLVFCWNEYLLALFLTNANAQTMPQVVVAQNATRGPQWWYLSVLVLIMIVPVIGMAIALERYIARGLLVGAVKG